MDDFKQRKEEFLEFQTEEHSKLFLYSLIPIGITGLLIYGLFTDIYSSELEIEILAVYIFILIGIIASVIMLYFTFSVVHEDAITEENIDEIDKKYRKIKYQKELWKSHNSMFYNYIDKYFVRGDLLIFNFKTGTILLPKTNQLHILKGHYNEAIVKLANIDKINFSDIYGVEYFEEKGIDRLIVKDLVASSKASTVIKQGIRFYLDESKTKTYDFAVYNKRISDTSRKYLDIKDSVEEFLGYINEILDSENINSTL